MVKDEQVLRANFLFEFLAPLSALCSCSKSQKVKTRLDLSVSRKDRSSKSQDSISQDRFYDTSFIRFVVLFKRVMDRSEMNNSEAEMKMRLWYLIENGGFGQCIKSEGIRERKAERLGFRPSNKALFSA